MTTDDVPGDRTQEGEPLYTPPPGTPGAGAMYPRVVRLDHDEWESKGEREGDSETLLATFEHYRSADEEYAPQPYFPIYRSTDGGESWSQFAEIHDTQNDWGLRYQPVLFELPEPIGPWPAGTVLAAGNSIPADRSRTKIDVYASEDHGRTWSFVSTVATGGRAAPGVGATPVWEPEFALDADGNLVCYFADERHSEKGYDQCIGHRVSRDGGRTWDEQVLDVAIPNGEDRPGMPVVTTLPDGRYALVYEIVGPTYDGGVFIETSPDGTSWGDPAAIGSPVRTADGHQLTNGPYVAWTPAGGDDGTVLVSGKTLRDRDGGRASGSGRTLLATTDFEDFGSWTPVSAPLWFDDELVVEQRTVGWTTPLLPTRDGSELLQLTSTFVDEGRCEIRYASGALELE
ncbi:sialidase family protein [Natronoglomus mannanivorans]|uniref:Glycoside hydrolase n=1 Tax=Natronoglomus mannanivorans TaxID=2979990 RepID=A0AAP3E216_9EURY|nr:glycoside hydrolase [Halobacteria archaeon AArc-xg1-1]